MHVATTDTTTLPNTATRIQIHIRVNDNGRDLVSRLPHSAGGLHQSAFLILNGLPTVT